MEALKHRYNQGRRSNLSFFRDARGLECDFLYESGNDLSAFEIKSGATIASDYFDSLNQVANVLPQISTKTVVYGDSDRQSRGMEKQFRLLLCERCLFDWMKKHSYSIKLFSCFRMILKLPMELEKIA